MRKHLTFFLLVFMLLQQAIAYSVALDPGYIPLVQDPLTPLVDYTDSDGGGGPITPSAPPPTGTTATGSTVLPEIAETPKATQTVLGDFMALKDDYLQITLQNPSQQYIKTEVGGVALTDFTALGLVGNDGDAEIYKYQARFEAYLLAYSAYPTNYFFSLDPKTQNHYWLLVRYVDLNYEKNRAVYSFEHSYYDPGDAATKANGGAFDAQLDVSFSLPFAGQTIGIYEVAGVQSKVLSVETCTDNYESGIISQTDPRYSTAAGPAQEVKVISTTEYNAGDSDVENALAGKTLGVISTTAPQPITYNSQLAQGMGTNSRIASGNSYSLSGDYKFNVGAHAFVQRDTVEYGYLALEVDNSGLIQYTKITQYAPSTTFERIISVGVQNKYVKQRVRIEVEVLTSVKDLTADLTDPAEIDIEPPFANETIYFDDYSGGDSKAGVEDNTHTINWVLIAIIAGAILGLTGFVLLRSKTRVIVIRA